MSGACKNWAQFHLLPRTISSLVHGNEVVRQSSCPNSKYPNNLKSENWFPSRVEPAQADIIPATEFIYSQCFLDLSCPWFAKTTTELLFRKLRNITTANFLFFFVLYFVCLLFYYIKIQQKKKCTAQ